MSTPSSYQLVSSHSQLSGKLPAVSFPHSCPRGLVVVDLVHIDVCVGDGGMFYGVAEYVHQPS